MYKLLNISTLLYVLEDEIIVNFREKMEVVIKNDGER